MSLLTEKEVLNNAFKAALDMEERRQAKYAFLAEAARDPQLKELLASLAAVSRRHAAMLKREMKNLNIR